MAPDNFPSRSANAKEVNRRVPAIPGARGNESNSGCVQREKERTLTLCTCTAYFWVLQNRGIAALRVKFRQCLRSRPRIWSRETVPAVPFRVVSPLILHTQAEFGAYYSRGCSRQFQRLRSFIYLNRLTAVPVL